VQTVLMLLLICILLASVVSFAVMGWLQKRRSNALEARACEMNMRFSAEDPFDVPQRYAPFTVIGSGHSARASNVTYGRIDGWAVRAFDFRYEVGHGTRRETRRYGIVLVETDHPFPNLLMWHDRDAQWAPLPAQRLGGRIAPWSFRGDEGLAAALAGFCREIAERGVSVQVRQSVLMFSQPVRDRKVPYLRLLGQVGRLIARLKDDPLGSAPATDEAPEPASLASPARNHSHRVVENRPGM